MRLYIEDTYTFPDATRDQIDQAFGAFDSFTPDIALLGHRPVDLDLGADLGDRELTFTWYLDIGRGDDEWPRFYVSYAREVASKLASAYMLHCDLPRTVVDNRFSIRADNGAWSAVGSLVFTVPAPR